MHIRITFSSSYDKYIYSSDIPLKKEQNYTKDNIFDSFLTVKD